MTVIEVRDLRVGQKILWGWKVQDALVVAIDRPPLAGPDHRDLVIDLDDGQRVVHRALLTDPIRLAPTPIDKGEVLEAVRWPQDAARVDFDTDDGTSIVGVQVKRRGDAWVVEIIQYSDMEDLLVQVKEAW